MNIKLCKREDPLLRILRKDLGAVPIRVPQELYQPFSVLELSAAGKVIPPIRGMLHSYLDDPAQFTLTPEELTPTRVAEISGTETISFDASLGIKILEGYLKGFLGGLGVNVPTLAAKLSSVQTMSYSFENVHQLTVDHGTLGMHLENCAIRKTNPAAAVFFGEGKSELLLIDRVLTSNNLSVTVGAENMKKLEAEVDAMVEEIGSLDTSLTLSRKSSQTVSFEGQKSLPFAFSCVKLILNEEGRIVKIPMADLDEISSRSVDRDEEEIFKHFLISEEPQLFDL